MKIDSVRCEVYNATYEPLSVVTGRRALNLCLKGRAVPMDVHPTLVVQTSTGPQSVPTRVRLVEVVKARRMSGTIAQLTQRNLFVRDEYTCQYCGRHRSQLKDSEHLSRDHVHPKSFGGKDVWTNVVTACSRCNNRKGNMFLSETGMVLREAPRAPTVFDLWVKGTTKFTRRS